MYGDMMAWVSVRLFAVVTDWVSIQWCSRRISFMVSYVMSLG